MLLSCCRPLTIILLLAALAGSAAGCADRETGVLQNARLRASFQHGKMVSITDAATGRTVRLDDEQTAAVVDGTTIDLTGLEPEVARNASSLTATYRLNDVKVTALYDLQPDWGFVSKRVRIEPSRKNRFQINDVRTWSAAIAPDVASTLPLTEGRFGTILRLADDGAGGPGLSVFVMHQNPYNVFVLQDGRAQASYAPEMAWSSEYGVFESDRLLIGVVARSGRTVPAQSVPEWTFVADYDQYLRDHPTIDEAESAALVESVRAFLLYRPDKSIRVHVPWTENDYQIDVATAEGWAEYERILDMAARLGAQYTLFTGTNSELATLDGNRDAWNWENLLFFGLGQKIRRDEWRPERDPVPANLQAMIDAGQARGLGYLAYAYPTLPFMQDPAWTAWAGDRLGGNRGVDTGQRGFQDWWVKTLFDFTVSTGAAGFAFDHWWIAYDDPKATSLYTQWYGARRILETLRQRKPDIVMDGRQQYQNFGPWTWLGGSYPHPTLTDEQPESFAAFPDLHTDRVSANRQRFAAWKYRVERFAPPEIMPGYITHQTERTDGQNVMRRDRFRPRDWDVLGWKYSLFSSIGTAPFNHTISYIPARDLSEFNAFSEDDAAFFRRWFDWTDANAGVLKSIRPILGPPMIGRVDGTAAFEGDHGFVFLFNPNYRSMDATFTLDDSIGLQQGSQLLIRELHPEQGRLIGKPREGIWTYGDQVQIPLRPTEALVLEVTPAPARITAPLLFNVPGRAALSGSTLTLTEVTGEAGTTRQMLALLPGGQTASTVTINGRTITATSLAGTVTSRIAFDGAAFGRAQSVVRYDPAFAGGTLSGTVTIPQRVFTQLEARRAAWPVPYTADDLRAPWLGSHRLLLFVQMAEPSEDLALRLTVDGRRVPLIKAYNSIYGHAPRRTFLGFYADVSALAPGVAHEIALEVPTLPAGTFQGLFFENVEPEWTSVIK